MTVTLARTPLFRPLTKPRPANSFIPSAYSATPISPSFFYHTRSISLNSTNLYFLPLNAHLQFPPTPHRTPAASQLFSISPLKLSSPHPTLPLPLSSPESLSGPSPNRHPLFSSPQILSALHHTLHPLPLSPIPTVSLIPSPHVDTTPTSSHLSSPPSLSSPHHTLTRCTPSPTFIPSVPLLTSLRPHSNRSTSSRCKFGVSNIFSFARSRCVGSSAPFLPSFAWNKEKPLFSLFFSFSFLFSFLFFLLFSFLYFCVFLCATVLLSSRTSPFHIFNAAVLSCRWNLFFKTERAPPRLRVPSRPFSRSRARAKGEKWRNKRARIHFWVAEFNVS